MAETELQPARFASDCEDGPSADVRLRTRPDGRPSTGPPGEPGPIAADAPDEVLVEAFWSLARQMRRASAESLARWDITPSQSRALRVLARHGGIRLTELSEHLRIAPRSTTEVVDGLETKGLIQRLPDPGDRRATLVALTARGEALGHDVASSRSSEAGRVFERLSPQERVELTRLLSRLRED